MYRAALTLVVLALLSRSTAYAQDPTAAPADDCVMFNDLAFGINERTLTYDEAERRYLIYVPEGLTEGAPLVISLHGLASSPQQHRETTQWDVQADAHGFPVVYPAGTGFPARWNAGYNPFAGVGVQRVADDVGFISALIDTLSSQLCTDPARVYVDGFSNGGGMANRVGCELADKVAAIGGVAGAYAQLEDGCSPARPMPVMAIHGTADPIVPYTGVGDPEDPASLPDIETWVQAWAERSGCDLTPEPLPAQGEVTGIRYGDCDADAEVILYTVDGGGHTWPGGGFQPTFIVGPISQDITASAVLWSFFQAHPLPGED